MVAEAMNTREYYSLRWVERQEGKGIDFMVEVQLSDEWEPKWVVKKYRMVNGEFMLLNTIEKDDRHSAYMSAGLMMFNFLAGLAEQQGE